MSRRTALITGCSEGGLGAAIAEAFHEKGFHVFATARTTSKAASLARDGIEILPLDVTSDDSVAKCLETIKAKTGGKLDVLVNNAGYGILLPLLDTPLDKAQGVFDTNLWGTFRMSKAFAPLLIARKGAILNICSIAAAVPFAFQGMNKFLPLVLSCHFRDISP